MRTPAWQIAIDIEHAQRGPVFRRIADAVVAAIRDGRLTPGARLPGSRPLAASVGVHRNTVLAAFDELEAQGWIESEPGKGTFVTRSLPAHGRTVTGARPAGTSDAIGFSLAPTAVRSRADDVRLALPKRVLSMAWGAPDPRLAPAVELARAYGRVLRSARAHTLLGYADPRGHERLRSALASMLTALRGLNIGADGLAITRGSQLALYLVAQAIVRPGDTVAVEALGYAPAWDAFRAAGAKLIGIPVDDEGLRVDKLAALASKHRIAAVYVTPHHQYPTTAVMSAARRLRLLALARANRFAIVEDDYDHEVHYEGKPVLPMASADRAGVCIYVGTMSKVLAPGVRIGYVVAPRPLLERIVGHRVCVDRQGDPAVELAVAELLEDGIVQRHARRMSRIYHQRRDALVDALERRLSHAVTYHVPRGGMAMWVRAKRGIDVEAWADRALGCDVHFQTAKSFALDSRVRPYLRLGYAARTEPEIRRAVSRMARALEG